MVRSLRIVALVATVVLVSSAAWALCPGNCISPHDCVPQDPPGQNGGCTYKVNPPYFCYEFWCKAPSKTALGETAVCDSEQLLLDVLATLPEDAGANEVVDALARRAQDEPLAQTVLDSLRIVGDDGELFRGPGYGQPPQSRQIANAEAPAPATVAAE